MHLHPHHISFHTKRKCSPSAASQPTIQPSATCMPAPSSCTTAPASPQARWHRHSLHPVTCEIACCDHQHSLQPASPVATQQTLPVCAGGIVCCRLGCSYSRSSRASSSMCLYACQTTCCIVRGSTSDVDHEARRHHPTDASADLLPPLHRLLACMHC